MILAPPKLDQIKGALRLAGEELGQKDFSDRFLVSEWLNVVDAWQVCNAETTIASVPRLGRKNRLGAKQRETIMAGIRSHPPGT